MMHLIHTSIEWAAIAVDLVAAIVMILAFLVSVYAFAKASVRETTGQIQRVQMARCALGVKVVFALELLIISDLLHTIVSRTMDDLLFLAALVVIRTIVAFFLNREIQEIEMTMEK